MPNKKQKNTDMMVENDQPPVNTRTSRYGRQIKKPFRYEPVEKVTDDFSDYDSDVFSSEDEYDSPTEKVVNKIEDSESDGETLGSDSSDESDDGDASDADEQGNLKDFVVYSDSESEIE